MARLHDIVDAAVGTQHVLLLARDGTVMAWGIWANGKGPTEWVLKPIPLFKVVLDH